MELCISSKRDILDQGVYNKPIKIVGANNPRKPMEKFLISNAHYSPYNITFFHLNFGFIDSQLILVLTIKQI